MSFNLNDSTPPAPSGKVNVGWQADGSGNISANIPSAAVVTPGNLTEATSDVLTITGGTDGVIGNVELTVKEASASQDGYLSSADFTTFAAKQAALGYSPLNAADNLSDLASVSTARTNLGLAASATTDTTNAANISSGTLPAARLPNPSPSTLGGVESAAAVTHEWVDSISTAGVPHLSQPVASDISGLGTAATMPSTAFDASGAASAVLASSVQKSANLSDIASASTARTNLGLGTASTQPSTAFDSAGAATSAVAAIPTATASVEGLLAASDFAAFSGKQAALGFTPLNPANNLSDVSSAPTSRTNLGLGSSATTASSSYDAAGAATAAVAAIPNASVSVTGLLTSANFTAFNSKQAALGFTPLNPANNLSEVTPATARTNLGLGSSAVLTAGAANGTATLDSGGKLTAAQIPASLVGAVVFQGTWNAATNTPTLASGVGTKGFYYKTATAGTTTIDGISVWNLGDTIIFDGTTWDKIDGQAVEVLTVFGRSGAVTATTGDYTPAQVGLGNVANALQLVAANNLSDVASASTSRTNLGLGSAATTASTAYDAAGAATSAVAGIPTASASAAGLLSSANWSLFNAKQAAITVTNDTNVTAALSGGVLTLGFTGQLAIARGGTGAATASAALTALGGASSGVNSSITSLTGLTTPLSVAQGGNGTATPAMIAGTNITLSGTWPAITISAASTTSLAFSALVSSTNSSAAMVVGSGASLAVSGTGTIAATSVLASGVPTLNQNTTGTASNVTGVVALANGGTGVNAASNSALLTALGAASLTAANTFSAQITGSGGIASAQLVTTNGASVFYSDPTITAAVTGNTSCFTAYATLAASTAANGLFGFDCGSPTLGGGATIGTAIGLLLSPQKVSGVTTGYGIQQNGASDLNTFAGSMTVAGTLGVTGVVSLTVPLAIASGGTGATTAAAALTALGAQAALTVTNDTNVTGSLTSGVLTLGFTGTLASGRLNANVVQSVTNDTNVTGAISAQALTLAWSGTLAKARTLATTVYTDQANTFTGTVTFNPSVLSVATFKSSGSSGTQVIVDSGAASQTSYLTFDDAGSAKWNIGKGSGNNFFLFDVSVSRNVLNAQLGGAAILMQTSGNLLVGTGTDNGLNKLQINGSAATVALATPGAPTVTPTGTAGSTNYSYTVVALQSDGSTTLAGTAGTTSTGNATLSGTNYNALSWTAVANAASYSVYRTVGGATQGRIANAQTATTLNDTGLTASGSSPTANTTGGLTVAGPLTLTGGLASALAIAQGGIGASSFSAAGLPTLSGANTFTSATNTQSSAGLTSWTVNTTLSSSSASFIVQNDLSASGYFSCYGSATPYSLAGIGLANWSVFQCYIGSGFMLGCTSAAPLVFFTNNVERMRILSGGNVGVGNTNPASLFNVGTAFSVDGSGNAKCVSLDITAGTNTKTGSGTLVAGTVTISNTSVTANSKIFVTPTANSANSGALAVTAKTAGTSFVVKSSNAADTSTFDYFILETA